MLVLGCPPLLLPPDEASAHRARARKAGRGGGGGRAARADAGAELRA